MGNTYSQSDVTPGATSTFVTDKMDFSKFPPGTRFVGFAGRDGAGKDSTGDALCLLLEKENIPFNRRAMAGPLKEMCRVGFKFTEEQLYGSLKNDVDPFWGVSPRFVLRHLGTEGLRNVFGGNVHVAMLWRTLEENTLTVCCDIRFPEEYSAFRNAGGKIYLVARDPSDPWSVGEGRLSEEEIQANLDKLHASEAALYGYEFDGIIDNSGSLEDLSDRVSDQIKPFVMD